MNEQKLNLKFVGEVEKYPLLYNYELPEYSRKDLLEKAWTAVGKEVNLTASECKEKWKNLRTVFVRNMKPAPSGSGSKKKKPYYLTEAMQFTIPFIKAVTATSHGNLPSIGKEVHDIPENEDDIQSESQQHQSQNESNLDQPSHNEELSQPELRVQRDQPPPNSLNGRPQNHSTRKQKRSINEVDNSFADYLKAKKAAITSMSSERSDAKKMFVLSLLPELDEMNVQQMKMFKRKVLQLIDDILSTKSPAPTLLSPRSVACTPLSSPLSLTSSVSATAYYESVQEEFIDDPALRYQISNTGQDLPQTSEDPLLQQSSQEIQTDNQQVYPQYSSTHFTQL